MPEPSRLAPPAAALFRDDRLALTWLDSDAARVRLSWLVLWNAFKRLAAGCSADEKRALFLGTACQVYGLDLAKQGINA